MAEDIQYMPVTDVLALVRHVRPDMTEASVREAIAEVTSTHATRTMHPQLIPDETTRVVSEEQLQYLFRAHVNGTFVWTCPFDGHVNQTIARASTLKHQCSSGYGCRRTVALGHILYLLPMGRIGGLPEDMIVPDGPVDPLPLGEIGRYRPGKPAHRIRRVRVRKRR